MIGAAHGLVGVATAVYGSRLGRQRAVFGHCRLRCEAERLVLYTPVFLSFRQFLSRACGISLCLIFFLLTIHVLFFTNYGNVEFSLI